MTKKTTAITRSRAIALINDSIENFATFYDSYCSNNRKQLTEGQKEIYRQMNEAIYIIRTDANYRKDLEKMPLKELAEFLRSCREMAETQNLFIKYSFPIGEEQTCFSDSDGYTGHQGRNNPEVSRDYPVFLQAGNSTGIVPPEWAFSRELLLNDKVDYYVVKN
ncbi:hypothetical protein [Treponema sp.]|uniref:hypothetical protein n=1 Tax=Treponema sp. TaxID=166 RepID=UPI003F021C49